MAVCCVIAAGSAVGIGAYFIIAGVAAGLTTLVLLALKALSQLPSFSENKKLRIYVDKIEGIKEKMVGSLQGLIDKMRGLFSSSSPSSCSSCHGTETKDGI